MIDTGSDRIAITYTLTAGDYAEYFAAVFRRGQGRTSFYIQLALPFSAIPAALLFRWFAARMSYDTDVAELVGRFSLFAYALGYFATKLGWFVTTRTDTKQYLNSLAHPCDPKTAVFDRDGITVTGKTSRATWQWAAISGLTREGDLLLLWIGPSMGLLIPCRSFADPEACEAAQVLIRERLAETESARTATAPPFG